MWPFGHRHKWIREGWVNLDHSMVWDLRRCQCGAMEIRHAGPAGDGKWHPFDGSFRSEWEREWFEKAQLQWEGIWKEVK